jgi:hypothetical protein
MSELEDAIAMLERAVARLETAAPPRQAAPDDPRVPEIAASLASRVDSAIAKIEQLLGEGG